MTRLLAQCNWLDRLLEQGLDGGGIVMFGGVWITVKVANVGVVRKWKCLSNGRLGEND